MVKVEGFKFPYNLLYSKDHLWVKVQKGNVQIGLTNLGEALCKEIVHIDLPFAGNYVKQGDEIGAFETIKAVIRIHAPFSGKIKEINQALYEQPDIINADPYGRGWLLTIEPNKSSKDIKSLMSATEAAKYYRIIIEEEKAKFGEYTDEPE